MHGGQDLALDHVELAVGDGRGRQPRLRRERTRRGSGGGCPRGGSRCGRIGAARGWVKEKKKDLIWKDVKVINAEILEEWLEVAPTVSAWLAIKHLSKFPSEGIQSTEDFWEEWSSDGSSKIKMLPDVLLGGRETQTEKMFELILNPSIIPIQAESREETLAFIIASFKNDSSREEDFFARSIIVDNPETFRKLSVIKNPLILIPRFEDDGVMNRADGDG